MSVGMPIVFEDGGSLATLNLKLLRLSRASLRDLLEAIGSEVESQTRHRIQTEKRTPDGSEWVDWSPGYAGTRHGRANITLKGKRRKRGKGKHPPHPSELRKSGGHSLLQLDGGLLDSIQFDVQGDSVLVGSNLEYARAMDSARQFLGLSDQNVGDLESMTTDFFKVALR